MADDSDVVNDRKTKPRLEKIDDNQQWWQRFVPNSNRWSDVNISRFLSFYKTHSVLWNPTHMFYRDQTRRLKAYTSIAERLNLRNVNNKECIELVKSLKDLYAKEREKLKIEEKCSRKYTSPPIWYQQVVEIVECVKKKLEKLNKDGSSSLLPESVKPWEICCRRLYTEDIWTPKHFNTNVTDWFLTSQDGQLFCTCKKSSETVLNNVSSTESSSACYGDNGSDSSHEIYRCINNNDDIQTCELKNKSAVCENCFPNETEIKLEVVESTSENTVLCSSTDTEQSNVDNKTECCPLLTLEKRLRQCQCKDEDSSASSKCRSISSRSSTLLSECRTLSEKGESDHRLDYEQDPTLCEKCAVDRVPVSDFHRNVIHYEDPRISELDKYCRYKNWDSIYHIKTQVADDDSIILVNEVFSPAIECQEEVPSPGKQNHSSTEVDVNRFIDPESSEAREVSLNKKYKREYGLNIEINQPRHYACEVSESPSHRPAQLIL